MSEPDERLPKPPSTDVEAPARELEMELQLRRANWQKARTRRGTWRALSLLFLLLVIFGALAAYLFLQPRLRERADERSSHSERTR
jgi:hypothetical protein